MPLNHQHTNRTYIHRCQTALQLISSWMSANLLTLNSSKTEFLIIGLKQQLSKIHNSSFNTTRSACKLGFIFDEHLTFSDQISSLSKPYYSHIRELSCTHSYFDSKTASTSQPLLSTPHLTTVTLWTTIFRVPKCQINRLQQIQNCLARTVVKAPKFFHITPILRSLHWLKINERIEYKLLLLSYKVLTTRHLQFDVCLVEPAPHPLPSSFRQPHPVTLLLVHLI